MGQNKLPVKWIDYCVIVVGRQMTKETNVSIKDCLCLDTQGKSNFKHDFQPLKLKLVSYKFIYGFVTNFTVLLEMCWKDTNLSSYKLNRK